MTPRKRARTTRRRRAQKGGPTEATRTAREATTMKANDSTSLGEERTHAEKEPQDWTALDNLKNMVDTEIMQYADRQSNVDTEELAELLRQYADTLESDGYEPFRPRL